MPENSFDKELIASNLLGANTLQELHQKEKILSNTKMIILSSTPVKGSLDYEHLKDIREDEMIQASIKGASGNLTFMNAIFSKALQ